MSVHSQLKLKKQSLLYERDVEDKDIKISPGVAYTHIELENDTLLESAHILEVDIKNAYLNMHVRSPDGKVGKLNRVRNIIEDMELKERSKVVAAVNGDFFSHLGIPSGLQISNGEIITSPSITKVAMVSTFNQDITLNDSISMFATLKVKSNLEQLQIDAINCTRKLKDSNHLFLYNSRFRESTKTPKGGVEVVLSLPDSDKLMANKPIKAQVLSVLKNANTKIDPNHFVLSATGHKAKWLIKHLKKGMKISIKITFDKKVNNAKEVISGNSTLATTLLRKGQINDELLDTSNPYNVHRHPRTMLSTKNNKLYIIIVDGRQPGHSDGITMAEGAQYLQQIGMKNAINLDGGGSTTCFVRKPGDMTATLVNRPSDGFEREVGNALIVTSLAPIKSLKEIIPLEGSFLKVIINGELTIKLKGHDSYINALPLKNEDVSWEVIGEIGNINNMGHFQASEKPCEGKIVIRKDKIVKQIRVQIVDKICRLKISPERIVVEPKKTINFLITAYDSVGDKIYVSSNQVNWQVKGDIGSISPKGCFKATSLISNGSIIAKYQDARAESKVNIGQQPELITGFETIDNIAVSHTRALENSVTLTKVERPNPVRFGRYSGKLSYDFTGMSGNSKATLRFSEENRKGYSVKGQPYRFGLWVYGDSNNHWLRLGVADANGETQSLNFTVVGGLDWTGWKYVYADIPKHFSYPIRVLTLYLMEMDDANKNCGVIYFDNLRAEYIPIDEDVEGPIFSQFNPLPFASVSGDEAIEVSVRIEDMDSGVDKASVNMWINNQIVDSNFDITTGIVKYRLNTKFLKNNNHIVVEAIDNVGNPSVPNAEWMFSITNSDSINRQ